MITRSPRCEPYCLYEFGAESCDAFGASCIVARKEADRLLAAIEELWP